MVFDLGLSSSQGQLKSYYQKEGCPFYFVEKYEQAALADLSRHFDWENAALYSDQQQDSEDVEIVHFK